MLNLKQKVNQIHAITLRALQVIKELGYVAIIALFIYLLVKVHKKIDSWEYRKEIAETKAPPRDTIKVKQIPPVVINHIYYPAEVKKEAKPDTVLRKQIEQHTLITGIKEEGNKVLVDKIDSSGEVTENTYDLKPIDQYKINAQGEVEVTEDKKKKRNNAINKALRKLELAAAFTAGIIVGRATK